MKPTWCIALIVAAGCYEREPVAPSNTPVPEPLALAQTPVAAEATPGYVGVLTPRSAAEVPARFTTKVLDYVVNLGDHVEAGAPLAHLDVQPLLEALAVAKAERNQASVAYSAAAAALRSEKRGFRAGVASKQAVAEAGFKVRDAGSALAGANAKLDALKKEVEATTLLSPIAGKVALRYVEVGGRVAEGDPVVRVITSDELFVKFAIPAEDIGKVKENDVIDVAIESRDKQVQGIVKRVSPELDPVAQMILAEADLTGDVSGEALQSGVVCRILVAKK